MADLFRRDAVGRVFQRVCEGVDLANQRLAPSSDRRNVTELWRVRLEREQAEITRAGDHDGHERTGGG